MRRRLVNFALVISLVLCTATIVSWVRSYSQSDEMEWMLAGDSSNSIGSLVKFCSASGSLDLEIHRFTSDVPLDPQPQIFEFQGEPAGLRWIHRQLWVSRATFFDYFWITDHGVRENPHLIEEKFSIATPHWFLFIMTLLLPTALLVRKMIRRAAAPVGACRVCRYDLTGNASGVCPECGTRISI